MTQDEIIRIAREVGLIPHEANIAYMQGNYPSKLERFAALVATREREACAKLCEYNKWGQGGWCAKAIRARGEK